MTGNLQLKDRKSKYSTKILNAIFVLFICCLSTEILANQTGNEVRFHAHVVPRPLATLNAPGNGTVTLMRVALGETVSKGQFLGWFYSNGENIKLQSPQSGILSGVHFKLNQPVKKNQPILSFADPNKLDLKTRLKAVTDFVNVGQKVYDSMSGELFGTVNRVDFDRGFMDLSIRPIRSDYLRLGNVHFLSL